jgi:hypothetical protein
MILALDLEHTLISSAVSCFVRPHLDEFLKWADNQFEHIVLFTTVSPEHVRRLQRKLLTIGETGELFCSLQCVPWPCKGKKDLRFVSNNWKNVLMIDDIPKIYAVEAQLSQWLAIPAFEGDSEDTELLTLRDTILTQLARSSGLS